MTAYLTADLASALSYTTFTQKVSEQRHQQIHCLIYVIYPLFLCWNSLSKPTESYICSSYCFPLLALLYRTLRWLLPVRSSNSFFFFAQIHLTLLLWANRTSLLICLCKNEAIKSIKYNMQYLGTLLYKISLICFRLIRPEAYVLKRRLLS
jgi:hypothetical protein